MKKITLGSILLLIVTFTIYKAKIQAESSYLTELMLNNIECLATSESLNVRCFGYGSVDCPKDGSLVLYYLG